MKILTFHLLSPRRPVRAIVPLGLTLTLAACGSPGGESAPGSAQTDENAAVTSARGVGSGTTAEALDFNPILPFRSPFAEYPIPTPTSVPAGLAWDVKRNVVWFTEMAPSKIGQITPSGVITEYQLTTPEASPYQITVGPDGNAWFTESDYTRIGRITPSGVVTEFSFPGGMVPLAITSNIDGNLWFTAYNYSRTASAIVKMTTAGVPTIYPLAPTAGAGGIARDETGNLWFTEPNLSRIGEITTAGNIVEYPIAAPSYWISWGSNGNMWFTEPSLNQVLQIASNGAVTAYPLPTPNANPGGITWGPDENIWFTESGANQIAKITPYGGQITEYAIPSGNFASDIISGPDQNMWFTEPRAGVVGQTIGLSNPPT
jgi:streptogramin lyase